MKKIFITFFILVSLCKLTYAQKASGEFEFGANIGYNSSYVTTNGGSGNSGWISGFNAGLTGDYYFSEKWSVKTKLTYDEKGWRGDSWFTTGTTSNVDVVNFRVNYITIPITADWHFGETKNWNLNFGPYIGILTSGKTTLNGSDLDIKHYFNPTDVGLALGAAYKFAISDNSNLFFEYDTQIGAANVVKVVSSNNTSYSLIRGSLNVGLCF